MNEGTGGKGGSEFAQLLKALREASGLSQRALARAAQINPAIISRMEGGERGPSGPAQVFAIARALSLGQQDTDALLASAGFWPGVYLQVGPDDPTLLAVARTLATEFRDEAAKARFRQLVALLAEQWQTLPRRDEGSRREG
ncbi:MAG: helix-turn-helix transcriptional regulator [Dehalococcoidales bacterium]|nr:helix-turn-helix transcriptional regulator [Dehalococcoidales bacterium]